MQSAPTAHIVVQAAKTVAWFEQLKQAVPEPHGFPQSAAYVVQRPCTHATPGVALNWTFEPSSVVGCPSPQPQAG